MLIFFALGLCCLSILIFMYHSYHKWGAQFTFNFFFLGFLVALIKEGPIRMNGILIKNPETPYAFLIDSIPMLANCLLAILGWLFTFYLGWYMAYRILRRSGFHYKGVFIAVFVSGLVTASIGYAVEATAIALEWWHWTINDDRFAHFLVGAHFVAIETWMHFPTQYLILPYCLIELSKFKKVEWKGVFFLIPFVHSMTTHLRPEQWRIHIEHAALVVLTILVFVYPLRLFLQEKETAGRTFEKWRIESFPFIIFTVFLCGLVFCDMVLVKNLQLLLSLLPMAFIALLAIEKIPWAVIIILSVVCAVIFGKFAVPALVLTGFLVLLRTATWIQLRLKKT